MQMAAVMTHELEKLSSLENSAAWTDPFTVTDSDEGWTESELGKRSQAVEDAAITAVDAIIAAGHHDRLGKACEQRRQVLKLYTDAETNDITFLLRCIEDTATHFFLRDELNRVHWTMFTSAVLKHCRLMTGR